MRQVVAEARAASPEFRRNVQVKLRASYSHHYRVGMVKLLRTLVFRSSNTAHAPIIAGIALVLRHASRLQRFGDLSACGTVVYPGHNLALAGREQIQQLQHGVALLEPDNREVSGIRQTSVHVPACAVDALDRHRTAHGLSRDEAVRRLLTAHVDRQMALPPPDRLTHISTILRHPLRPLHPGAGPDLRVHLKVRLPDELAADARKIGLVLPGQSRGGGNGDYRARTLTDSIMTAIAGVQPMTDEVLAGLRSCLRHQSAIGLWRLAVAATLTSEEQRVLEQWRALRGRSGDSDDALERVVEILREESSAWHDQFRFQVVRFLVRRFLSAEADEEVILYDQRVGFKWAQIRDNFEQFGLSDEEFDNFNGWGLNLEGRGAANVWRIRRKVVLEDLCRWLLVGDPSDADDIVTKPPGWTLQVPDGWTAIPLDGAAAAHCVQELVRSGRALLLSMINPERKFLWPLVRDETGASCPVPGLDTVVAAVRARRARQRGSSAAEMPSAVIAELLLVTLIEQDGHDRTAEMPVHIAHRAGLVDDAERDRIVKHARDLTRERMREFLDALRPRITNRHQRDLEAAMDSPTEFQRIAFRNGLPAKLVDRLGSALVNPVHGIKVTSLAQAVVDRSAEPALTWLTGWFFGEHLATLREDRMNEWQRGMDNNRHRSSFQGADSRRSGRDTHA